MIESFLSRTHTEYLKQKPGLERIRNILDRLGNPQKKYPSILIAGSNGKGTVARLLSHVLAKHGLNIGLYTSPHLLRVNERIAINNLEISDSDLEHLLIQFEALDLLSQDYSFFEILTALACEHFKNSKIDLAILEVGLGGRLDATNVIDPILSAITSISLEHTEYLGATEELIATEKMGIFRKNIPCFVGVVNSKIKKYMETERKACELHFIESQKADQCPQNYYLAEKIYEKLAKHFSLENKWQEYSSTFFQRARYEKKGQWIIDAAHNQAAWQVLVECLKVLNKSKIRILASLTQEKSIQAFVDCFKKLDVDFYFCPFNQKRSKPYDEFKLYEDSRTKVFKQAQAALQELKQDLKKGEIALLTGSLFLIGELYESIKH